MTSFLFVSNTQQNADPRSCFSLFSSLSSFFLSRVKVLYVCRACLCGGVVCLWAGLEESVEQDEGGKRFFFSFFFFWASQNGRPIKLLAAGARWLEGVGGTDEMSCRH